MSNVTLTIGGRSYTIACDAGQEQHIAGLGATIDGKLASMGHAANQSEARALLFAALLLADENFELKRDGAVPAAGDDNALAPALESLAARLENLAGSLEQAAASA